MIHARENLLGINTHAVADYSDFIHESDVDIALAILNNLHRLSRLDISNLESPGLYDDIVDLLDFGGRLFIHIRYDLGDACERMNTVTRIGALWAVFNLEVDTTFQSAFLLKIGMQISSVTPG